MSPLRRFVAIALAVSAALALTACGTASNNPCETGKGFCVGNDAGPDVEDFDAPGLDLPDAEVEAAPACKNLQCQQVTCTSGETTVTGVVYDPGGKDPLYNVFVYVPNAALQPITSGPVCTACQAPASGEPVVSATTNEKGEFVLKNVPVGKDIPLVMQLGKWRRKIILPEVVQCQDNKFNTKTAPNQIESLVRLPKKQAEGSADDNIPLIAMVTGLCDYAECFLATAAGIDASEYGGPTSNKRVRFYKGDDSSSKQLPPNPGTSTALWGSLPEMMKYDIIFGSCECSADDRTANGYTNMKKYLEAGGRMFSTHYYYNFFATAAQCSSSFDYCNAPQDFGSVAQWNGGGYDNDPAPYYIDMSFPKGKAMANWLAAVRPLDPSLGRIDSLYDLRHDVDAVNTKATRWLYSGSQNSSPYKTLYMSFNTPVAQTPDKQCGRAVFSDVHLSGSSFSTYSTQAFPQWCSSRTPGSGYEKNEAALKFLFFDLSSCVQDDKQAPIEPPK